jgi:hypothetical protein
LIEHRLYGVPVFSDFGMFDNPEASRSADTSAMPGLRLRQAEVCPGPSGLHICQQFRPVHGRGVTLRTDRPLAASARQQPWRLQVEDVVSFAWLGGSSEIDFTLGSSGNRDLLAFWFIHIFLPLHLTLERGYDFLHGAAVEIGQQPIVFVAPSGGGKSTLGAYFLEQGHAMLSDDKVATVCQGGQCLAVPSHPHHRPFRQYEVLGHPIANFATRAGPIAAIYLLQVGTPEEGVQIEEVQGFRKFEELMPAYLYDFPFLRERRLQQLAAIAGNTRVFRVFRPWDIRALAAAYETIEAHARNCEIDTPGQKK